MNGESLEAGWTNPPLDARTRCFWWWLNGNVTKEAITRDLEQMKAKGMGGGLIFDADGSNQQRKSRRAGGAACGASEAWQELFVARRRGGGSAGIWNCHWLIQSGWNLGGPDDYVRRRRRNSLVWSKIDH